MADVLLVKEEKTDKRHNFQGACFEKQNYIFYVRSFFKKQVLTFSGIVNYGTVCNLT